VLRRDRIWLVASKIDGFDGHLRKLAIQ